MGKQSNSLDNIFLRRPTIKDYISLEGIVKNDVDRVINVLKPNKILRFKTFQIKPKKVDLWDLSWSDLILLKELVNSKNISGVIDLIYHVKEIKFIELDVFNCFAVYKWISEQLEEIAKAEIQELGGEATIEEKEAGVEMLNEFGYSVSLDVLTGGDMTKEEEILSKPYHVIFKKLCLNKTKSEIQKNYIENARRKNKTNSY